VQVGPVPLRAGYSALEQWQFKTRISGRLISNLTPPHRQLPRTFAIIAPLFSRSLAASAVGVEPRAVFELGAALSQEKRNSTDENDGRDEPGKRPSAEPVHDPISQPGAKEHHG
jgi:hypothetical protein